MNNKLAIHPREKIKVIKSNFSMGLLLLGNLADPRKIEPNGTFYTFDIAGNPNLDFEHVILEFSKMLIRNVTNEPFETFKDYCKNPNQFEALKKQEWYIFAWLIRNCLTHNQQMIFKDHQKIFLSTTWNGSTIDLSLENKELPLTIYGWFQCCALLDEMEEYAKTLK